MPLFQSTVLKKYTNALDTATVDAAYERFAAHFHNPVIQDNIRLAKEEQYQGEFLIDLFVKVLGYVKNPTPDFNLTTEFKNIKDSKKADGAILTPAGSTLRLRSVSEEGVRQVLGVIELKGTAVTDLGRIEVQAFGYKNNQPGCVYVITSNFEKLRFYIDNAVDFEEFNLFQLSRERFDVLWLCLSAEQLLAGKPKQLKEESLSQEEQITKQLYKDYSLFRNEVFQNIVAGNPQYDKLTLFKQTQKLLDRFLFIFFAEDRLLLPPNSILAIVEQWKDLRDKYDAYTPLYDRFKKYFDYMNTGHKGQKHDIFAYNGGLFKPDAILDDLKIDDDLLYKHTVNLSKYDFESEVSVNILGHIFEHSLNEIEDIQAELEGQAVDKSTSKRKKDGVFYTPKYITKYIVDNTVGKLCEEQKATLGIEEADYDKGRKNRPVKLVKALAQKLDDYRAWLLQLTICDPACGSGAFLNQALEFLIAEHAYVDELQAKLFGDALVLSEVENSILEHNLYGVDINNESVEIAKLSLWLRTAQKGRKLTSLNNNIKCGNSLIDDPAVAGDKAFDWYKEFPQVFQKKNKQAFHITTALHDSRTSQRMIDHKVRLKRDLGTNPYPNYTKLTPEEEILITQTVAEIVAEDRLTIPAYNICGDHMHLLLVCEEDEVPRIIQKIKAKTARAVNIAKGITTPGTDAATAAAADTADTATREHAPLASQNKETHLSREHAPLARGKKQNSLWTQKFGTNPITTEEQLLNTLNYIQNNRIKHELPENKELQTLIAQFTCTLEEAFAPQYKGGFDVVIGNPPYTYRNAIIDNEKNYFKKEYKSAEGNYDLYKFFMEKCSLITKGEGLSSFIVPNTFLSASTYSKLRELIINEFEVLEFYDLGLDVFENVVVESIIFLLKKSEVKEHNTKVKIQRDRERDFYDLQEKYKINLLEFSGVNTTFNIYISNEVKRIIDRMIIDSVNLDKICYCTVGINTGYIKNDLTSSFKLDERYHKMLNGKNIGRNYVEWDGEWIMYDPEFVKSKGDRGRSLPPKYIFDDDKILIQRTRRGMKRKLICYYDNEKYYNLNRLSNVVLKDENYELKYIYALLNSELLDFYFNKYFNEYEVKPIHLSKLPIKKANKKTQLGFSIKTDEIINVNKKLQKLLNNLLELTNNKFSIDKPSRKLQSWHTLDFKGFLKELKKAKVSLTLPEEAEWMAYFNGQKTKAQALQNDIDRLDKEIDGMVYELYGLTEEEIAIVESS